MNKSKNIVDNIKKHNIVNIFSDIVSSRSDALNIYDEYVIAAKYNHGYKLTPMPIKKSNSSDIKIKSNNDN